MQASILPKLSRTHCEKEQVSYSEWVAGISIVVYGVRIGIQVSKQEILDQFLAQFSLPWKPAKKLIVTRLYSIATGQQEHGPDYHLAYVNSMELLCVTDLAEVFFEIERNLIIFLSNSARHNVFIDGGVVEWKGKAILILGHCYTGKTTLIAELVRVGATYYSDEYAVLNAQGRLNPLPIRLSARDETGFHRLRYTAQSLGSKNGVKPLPLGMILITEFKPGKRWRPQQLSTGQAVLELLANSSTARWRPVDAMLVIQKAASQALALKGGRGEATEMIPSLLKRLG